MKRKVCEIEIKIDKAHLYALKFVDNQTLISGDREDIKYMMQKLIEEYKNWGLNVNIQKAIYLYIGDVHSGLAIKTLSENNNAKTTTT